MIDDDGIPTTAPYDVAALRARSPALGSGYAHVDGPGGSQVPVEVARAVAATLTAPIANRGRITALAPDLAWTLEASRRLGLGDDGALRIGLAPYSDDDDVDRLLAGLADTVASA